jgi:hypothetical protein
VISATENNTNGEPGIKERVMNEKTQHSTGAHHASYPDPQHPNADQSLTPQAGSQEFQNVGSLCPDVLSI